MQKFSRKQIYKAREPYETIQLLRGILYDCDIFLKETLYQHSDSRVTATMLLFGDDCFKDVRIGTNGKGMSSRYALASAYGEMMERLQCQMLLDGYRRRAYAEKKVDFLMAPDERWLPFSQVLEECGDYLRIFFHLPETVLRNVFEGLEQKECLCVPFYDVSKDRNINLPFDLISAAVTSNGMSAGNTPQEALNQGISELYERSSQDMIYRDNPAVPFLPDEMFEGTEVLRRLENLKEFGFDYRILDCSMDLDYPVIGLTLKNDAGIMMDIGADPNPVVALERCLTEQYQLVKPELLNCRFHKESCGLRRNCDTKEKAEFYHDQLRRTLTLGSGLKPDNIMHPSGVYSEQFTCCENPDSSGDFAYLEALTKRIGYHLLYRDCSWLGFPAYASFIPEISYPDYRYRTIAEAFARMLEYGRKIPEDLPCYENVLPILKRLDEKYVGNCPVQKSVWEREGK